MKSKALKRITIILLCLSLALMFVLSAVTLPVRTSVAEVENAEQVEQNTAESEDQEAPSETVNQDTKASVEDVADEPVPPILEMGEVEVEGEENSSAPAENSQNNVRRKKIVVFGEGKVYAKPDTAYVTLGVECTSQDSASANEQVNKVMQDILAYLYENGTPENDVCTNYFSVYERYDYSGSEQNFLGYQVTSLLEVKFRDLDNLSAHIDNLTKLGANRVGGIDFVCEDTTQYYQEALKMAVEDAKNKASVISTDDLAVKCVLEDRVCQHFCKARQALYNADNTIVKGELEIVASVKVIFE